MPYREPEPHERKHTVPAYIDGPIAWENPELPWFRRFCATLSASFLPVETARPAAEGAIGPAVRFAFLSALPWSLCWAIVPFTHSLLFKPSFGLARLENAGLSVEADLARAILLGLVLSSVSLVSWSVPFASMLRAFSRDPKDPQTTRAAYRTALYRVWVVPFGMAMFWLAVWAMPESTPPILGDLTLLCFQVLPRMLIVLHCHAMARYYGASSSAALVVAGVPLAVEWAAGLWVWHITQGLLPAMPSAVGGTGP